MKTTKPKKKLTADQETAASINAIYDKILDAIMAHQLPPGTKLAEERLAAIFSVSRTRVRETFARLAHEGIVTLIQNRGAFIASPTVEEAREILAVRKIMEASIVRQLAQSATKENIALLRKHDANELAAHNANDRSAIIRLSGEFHVMLAQFTSNGLMLRLVRELVSLNCLIIALYDSPGVPSCPLHGHVGIIDAIAAGDGARAARMMVKHLEEVESTLKLDGPTPHDSLDLGSIFSPQA
jgi:DNA-binding GntR family transcriptional regulator